MNRIHVSWLLLSCLFEISISGCSGIPHQQSWGASANLPAIKVIKRAALNAAKDPATWAPLAGAALLSIGNWDEELSEWAAEKQPVFGGNGRDASDKLRDAAAIAYLVTAFAAPSETAGDKARGLTVGLATIALQQGITHSLKSITSRVRPDGRTKSSFPSGHAAIASSSATLARRNLDYLELADWANSVSRFALWSVTAGTAWARVESEKHFVSDVLVGMALGHYVAAFMHEAFMEADVKGVSVNFHPAPSGGLLIFRVPI